MNENDSNNKSFQINKFFKIPEGYPKVDKEPLRRDAHVNNNQTKEGFNSSDLIEFNNEVLLELEKLVNPEKFSAFFKDSLTLKNISADTVTFVVPSNFIKKVISQQYIDVVSGTITRILGKSFKLIINVLNDEQSSGPIEPKNSTYSVKRADSVKDVSFTLGDIDNFGLDNLKEKYESEVINNTSSDSVIGKNIDPKKSFENFVVGPSNNLAHASAIAVSKNPGVVYSSLYIHGNSGLGKTHLLHAVANKISETEPSLRIYITTANEFMSEMIAAIQEKDIQSFRRKYSELIDVLMIDDIHELKNKPGTQNEFFHVFNELQRKKKQLIFTSDKDPKDITGIEDRIRTRLSSALVLEIQQPDLETRIAILKRKAVDVDVYLPDDVVNLIASCIKSNIRELEGSLIKLGAYSSVFNVDIDLETAKEQLKLNPEDQKKTVNIETITKTVSSYYKIPVPDIRSKARIKEVTLARHVAMYFSYYHGKSTLVEIGNYFGKRDHTSVMHGVNKIKKMAKDNDFASTLYEVESLI